ncbi:MAG: NAD(P)-dependent glycerol-3-phosphate dehydrogenase [Candidatus Cloacimonetes bacterium]|jgi:glycerol-3-phosphate dehydrogenase (NAD(P)+)|nr:NAD(P)-dependent glycerol-3-phosphate dehydrogenase [Candidatus Cloacimonadota bacterium]MDY0366009.1 NAD(P)H-dependent glycerol-3-phosphate dehydrogenase [Candidatus Syntrophosphaera sp.]
MRVAVIGGGGWGLALANLLAENAHPVMVWEHDPAFLQTLLATRSNPLLLANLSLPETVLFTGDFHALADFQPQLVVLATPTQFIRATLEGIPPAAADRIWAAENLKAVVNVAKGIEENTLLTPSGILRELLPAAVQDRFCSLSGPSHAEEVARRVPTTVVIAGADDELLSELQTVFSNSFFRAYRSTDLTGVEMGGAVKNVIAIAAGIVTGLGFGDNTMGALLTRGLVEIQRLGVARGAKAETFLGLSGVGDLITTAISPHSRNRHVGFEIGSGRKLSAIITEMKMVAEGVATTRSVHALATRANVEMPIIAQVYATLYQDKDPRQAILELMTRELKAE